MRVRIHNLNALRERIRQLREELAALRVYDCAALRTELAALRRVIRRWRPLVGECAALRMELVALRVYERAALAAERVRLEPDPSREAANAKRRERRQTSAGKAQSENRPANA